MWTVVLVYALSPSLLLFPSISLRFLIIVYFTLLLVKILLHIITTRALVPLLRPYHCTGPLLPLRLLVLAYGEAL